MLIIQSLKIQSTEATGYVYADQLTAKQLNKLHMSSFEDQDGYCFEVNAFVDYSVQWDEDIPMVTIEEVTLSYGNTFLTLSENEYDYDDLSIKLEQDGPYLQWKEDKDLYYEDSYDQYYNEE